MPPSATSRERKLIEVCEHFLVMNEISESAGGGAVTVREPAGVTTSVIERNQWQTYQRKFLRPLNLERHT